MNVVEKRTSIYDAIRNNCKTHRDEGIFISININKSHFEFLKKVTKKYIIKTLKEWYTTKKYDFDNENYLIDYREDIISLPNITPNGSFYPKIENIAEYNEIQIALNDILIHHNLDACFSTVANFNIRVQDGKNRQYENRMYSTTKLHSDSWVGHVGDAILTILIDGDRSTGINFYKPIGKVSEDFFTKIDDFDKGLNFFSELKYLCAADFEYAYIFDHGCLHKTTKNDGGLRISIDMAITMKNSTGAIEHNKENSIKRHPYMPIDNFLKLGTENIIGATETLEDAHKKYSDHSKYNEKPKDSIYSNLSLDKGGKK
jgi:hypothetical protein